MSKKEKMPKLYKATKSTTKKRGKFQKTLKAKKTKKKSFEVTLSEKDSMTITITILKVASKELAIAKAAFKIKNSCNFYFDNISVKEIKTPKQFDDEEFEDLDF